MTRGLNKVLLIGCLAGGTEMRYTPTGRPVITFTLATPRNPISANEGQHIELERFNVVAWDRLAEMCYHALSDGQQVYVEGHLRNLNWQDEQGRHRVRTEVVAHDVVALNDSVADS